MEYNDREIDFIYDESGRPYAMVYESSTKARSVYYYILNAQGDVMSLMNSSGSIVADYTYDEWGRTISITGSNTTMGSINPLRYRGYIYDRDTGLYYLQSRYYDPAIGRFINADTYTTTDADGLLGSNMFAYCENNPVMGVDPTGEFLDTVFDVISLCSSVAEVVANPADPWAWAGLVGDVVDLIPGVTGVGETVRAVNTVRKAAKKANKVVDIANNGHKAAKTAKTASKNALCFVAGTLVLTDSGYVPIEEIQAGDLVISWDEETGEVGLKPVVQTFVNEADELVYVSVAGNEIVCTNEHPFYSPVKGWIAACKLRAGDVLVTVNGELVVVEWVQHELLENPVKVYNFEVEGFHTYYVGADDGVLVHNSCAIPNNSKLFSSRHQAFNEAKRDLGIPTSSQPVRVTPNFARDGTKQPGRIYYFENDKVIRDDIAGHRYVSGSHFNTAYYDTQNNRFINTGWHYFYK